MNRATFDRAASLLGCLPDVFRLELRLSSQHGLWLQTISCSPDVLDLQLSFASNVLEGIWDRFMEGPWLLTLWLINTKKKLLRMVVSRQSRKAPSWFEADLGQGEIGVNTSGKKTIG